MIKSHDGQLSIEGNRAQLLFDFAHIYEEMIKLAPEAVQAVVMHNDKALLNADVDKTYLVVCDKLLNSIISVESEDEDDESSIF